MEVDDEHEESQKSPRKETNKDYKISTGEDQLLGMIDVEIKNLNPVKRDKLSQRVIRK